MPFKWLVSTCGRYGEGVLGRVTYDGDYDNDHIDDPDTYDDNVMHGEGSCELYSILTRGLKGARFQKS